MGLWPWTGFKKKEEKIPEVEILDKESKLIYSGLLKLEGELDTLEKNIGTQAEGLVKLKLPEVEGTFNKIRSKLPMIRKKASLLALYRGVEKKLSDIKAKLK